MRRTLFLLLFIINPLSLSVLGLFFFPFMLASLVYHCSHLVEFLVAILDRTGFASLLSSWTLLSFALRFELAIELVVGVVDMSDEGSFHNNWRWRFRRGVRRMARRHNFQMRPPFGSSL